jgi:flagella basal body P-ring formation protein FlgA
MSNLVVAAITAAAASDVSSAEIRLRQDVRTTKSVVSLGDVAELSADDPEEVSRLAAVELSPAPPPGGHRQLRLEALQEFLAFRGIDLTKQCFSGATQVTITRAAETLSRAVKRPNKGLARLGQRAAADAIVRYLRENAADEAWQVTVELSDDEAQVFGDSLESLTAGGGQSPWVGQQQFELTLQTNDGPKHIAVTAQVKLPPSIVVAIHAMPRGAIVRSSDIELQRISPGAAAAGSFQTAGEVVGKEAVKAIPAGQVLDATYVRPPVLVRAGDVVTIYGRNAGIVVRMTARAQESGARGELVSVESLLDRKTILARVCGLQEVEVYGGATTTSPAALTAERENRTRRSE